MLPKNKITRKACFLCGDPAHELPSCPSRSECVLLCREWGGQRELSAEKLQECQDALVVAFSAEELQVVRSYWHRGVCYLRLRSTEEATRATRLWGAGLQLLGQEFRIRVAKSTRSTGERTKEIAEEPKEPVVCLLCGDAKHVLKSCKFRNQGLRISSSALEGLSLEAAKEEVSTALGASGASLEMLEARWHGRCLYVTMRSASEVTELLDLAAGEGLEIKGATVSVEKAAGKTSRVTRVPGLRPRGPCEEAGEKELAAVGVQELRFIVFFGIS
eukprot:g24752.t1